MKRKVVSLMLVSAMVAGMLAGCGSDSGSSKGGILTLMVKTATGITR